MPRPYISIRMLLAFIAIAAIEFAALRSATAVWVDLCSYMTVAALVVATYPLQPASSPEKLTLYPGGADRELRLSHGRPALL